MVVSRWLTVIGLCLLASAYAQENRYMVFFTDKTGSAFSINNPAAYLSARAISRRSNQNISISEQDLPVVAGYVDAIKSTGARVLFTSRWFNAVLVEATGAELTSIEALASVDHVDYVAPGKNGTGGRVATKWQSQNGPPVANDVQNNMLGLDAMHADGNMGTGKLIAVFDSGFIGVNTTQPFNHIFNQNRIVDSHNFVYGNEQVFAYDDHGTEVISTIAANSTNYKGGAPDASFLLYVTEHVPTEYRVEEYLWAFAAERADSAGVDIISSSLGYSEFDDASMDYTHADLNGQTARISQAATWAFQRGILVVNSAGNRFSSTWNRITPPADAPNVLAIGALDAFGNVASFSLPGPNALNQIKPDVAALGVGVSVINFQGNLSTNNGTSFSCPLVAALAAGVWQMAPELTAAELLDMIRKSGSHYFNPDNQQGFGIPTYQAIKNIVGFQEQTEPITVYPNPAKDQLRIAQFPITGADVNVQLSTILGQPLLEASFTANWQSNPMALDVTGIAPGVYLLRVESNSIKKTIRVIIQ